VAIGRRQLIPMTLDTIEQKAAFVEAVLFVAKEPVDPQRLMTYLRCVDAGEFERILNLLEEREGAMPRATVLKRAGGGLSLVTAAGWHEQLKDFFSIRTTSRLTLASLETLAIVAYRQPVTLAEISDLRSVNSAGPVKSLLQKKLIRVTGRKKVPGLPALYATTREFLLAFGLGDLAELPSLEELTELFEEKEQPSLFHQE